MDNCFRATDFSFIETDTAAGFRCDIAGAYGQPYLPELSHLYRHLQFEKTTGNLSVKDSFTLTLNSSVIEHFVTRIELRIENGYAIIENCTDKLILKTVHSPVIHSERFVPTVRPTRNRSG